MTLSIKSTLPEMNDIYFLENKLGKLLSPRQANPEFVQKLKTRLTSDPRITLEAKKQYKALWILAVALFSGGLLLFIIALLNGKTDRSSN